MRELSCCRFDRSPPLLEPDIELWASHCIQDMEFSQPAAPRLIDAVLDEMELLG